MNPLAVEAVLASVVLIAILATAIGAMFKKAAAQLDGGIDGLNGNALHASQQSVLFRPAYDAARTAAIETAISSDSF